MTSNPVLTVADPAQTRFSSLEQLREAHADLLRRSSWGKDDPAFWDEVVAFVGKTCATGTILEADADRYSVQGLITYWANVLFRVNRQPSDTLLLDFDETWCPELSEDKRPYAAAEEFRDGRAQHLYGWRRLIQECLKRLDQNGLLAVIGVGGSGRSTLVQHGILPALQKDAVPGSTDWRVLPPINPGAEPLETLVRLFPTSNPAPAAALFRQDRGQLQRLLGGPEAPPALLIINRFEELFTRGRKEDCQAFLDNIGAVVEAGVHRIILILQPDYLGQVGGLETLGPAVEQGQVLMAFTARELRLAIEEPAKQVGLRFEPGLVDRLLLDVQGDPAAATLLQFTLLQLWRARRGNRITREAYDRLGGGRLALQHVAERLYQAQEARHDQEIARHVWLNLARPEIERGNDSGGITRDSLIPPDGTWERTGRVLGELVAAGLVHSSPSLKANQDRFVLAHHALVEVWPRLLEWLGEERDERRHWQRLRAAAEQWRASTEDRTLLWGGTAVQDALKFPALDELEKRFLDASNKEEKWQTFSQKLRLVAGVAVLGVIGLLGLGVRLAVSEVRRASAEAEAAQKDRHQKELDIRLSLMNIDAGARQLDKDDVAEAVVWYGNALELLERNHKDVLKQDEFQALDDHYRMRLGLAWQRLPALAQVLDHEKVQDAEVSSDGRWAVTASHDKTARLWNLRRRDYLELAHGVEVNTAVFSPDGKYLVTGTGKTEGKGAVHIWPVPDDPREGQSPRDRLPESSPIAFIVNGDLPLKVAQVDFNATGDLLLVTGSNANKNTSAAAVWQFQEGRLIGEPKTFRPPQGVVERGAFSPDGGRVVVVVTDRKKDTGSFTVWDARTGTELYTGEHPDAARLRYACFSPEETPGGQVLVTCGGGERAGEARLWSAGHGNPIQVPLRHKKAVVHAAFNSDGTSVITCSVDGSARLWELADGKPLAGKHLEHGLDVNWAAFSPDGRYAVTACRDRKARVWDVATGKLAVAPLNHGGTVNRVQFYPDGQSLFSFTGEGVALVWEMLDDRSRAAPLNTPESVQAAALSPRAGLVATLSGRNEGLAGNEARIWDAAGGELSRLPRTDATAVALSPDGARLVTFGGGPVAHLWYLGAGQSARSELRHQQMIPASGPAGEGPRSAAPIRPPPDRDGLRRVALVAESAVVAAAGLPHRFSRGAGGTSSPPRQGRWRG